MAKRLPTGIEAEVRRRAAAGESHREIAAWLSAEHGLEVAHTTVGRLLRTPAASEVRERPPGGKNITRGAAPRRAPGEPPSRDPSHGRLPVCGARKRQGPGICRRPAGWGTGHVGEGRCKLHGGCLPLGKRGGPPGNSYALKTGEYASVLFEVLSPEDQDRWRRMDTSIGASIDEELRLLTAREVWMLQRIASLEAIAGEGKLVLVKESEEHSPYFGDSERREKQNALERIRLVEDALTRIQRAKAHLIRLKHRYEHDEGAASDSGMMDQLLAAIEASRIERSAPAGEE